MRVLAIDIGGTNVKFRVTGRAERRRFPSGRTMTPQQMVEGVKSLAKDWKYDVVSIGYPGIVEHGHPIAEPGNLGNGWVTFDFEKAFKRPVKILNDAAMQALGSYRGGTMLFLGFGTGIGAALVAEGVVIPLEIGHLKYEDGDYNDYLSRRGLERFGKKKWRQHVAKCVERLTPILHLDDLVLGGGNLKLLKTLPPGCRPGDNAHAFEGGFRLWDTTRERPDRSTRAQRRAAPRSSPRRRAVRVDNSRTHARIRHHH